MMQDFDLKTSPDTFLFVIIEACSNNSTRYRIWARTLDRTAYLK
jgi:hypothetical protein